MSFICVRMKNDFHIKGRAPTRVLKQRLGGTRKWPIPFVWVASLGYVTTCIDGAGLGEYLLPGPNTLVR